MERASVIILPSLDGELRLEVGELSWGRVVFREHKLGAEHVGVLAERLLPVIEDMNWVPKGAPRAILGMDAHYVLTLMESYISLYAVQSPDGLTLIWEHEDQVVDALRLSDEHKESWRNALGHLR